MEAISNGVLEIDGIDVPEFEEYAPLSFIDSCYSRPQESFGILSKVKNKKGSRQPDYRGSITIEGVTYDISGWYRFSSETNQKSISLLLRDQKWRGTRARGDGKGALRHITYSSSDSNDRMPQFRGKIELNTTYDLSGFLLSYQKDGVDRCCLRLRVRPFDFSKTRPDFTDF